MGTYFTTQWVGSTTPVPVGPQHSAAAALVGRILHELQQILTPAANLASVGDAMLATIQSHTQCRLVGLFRLSADGSAEPLISRGDLAEIQQADSDVQKVLRGSLQKGGLFGQKLKDSDGAAMAVPVRGSGTDPCGLVLCGPLDRLDMQGLASLLEVTASAIGQLMTRDHLQRLEWESQVAAATCELISGIQGSQSFGHAVMLTANELKRFFQCQQVSVAMARRGRPGVELQAVSGLSEFDRSAAPIRLAAAALDEVAMRNEFTLWPPGAGQLRHATLALRKLATANRVDALVGLPLRDSESEVCGAIVAEGVRAVIHDPRQLSAWQAMANPIATALLARRKADKHLWDYLTPPREQRHRRRLIALAGVILVALAAMPIPHRIRTEGRVEPVVRRFVVAPYSGRLEKCHVEPGSLVKTGQVLATMDGRELGFELASLVAERYRAAKERDTATADHDPSAAQMAALEMDRLDARMALLRERTKNLAIVSPINGVVLKGELQDAEGAPVDMGQALFEVAPLDPIELELAIPADEIAWCRDSLPVHARLDGLPAGNIYGVVRTIHPRAEIRDAQNVFVARVKLNNSDPRLRPGMSGRAWIRAGYRPVAWVWLHKAAQRIRLFTGW